ncbi:MAG: hypothetical protein ACFB6R_08880 [Alphaproteobacteria bacterium]
MALKAAERGEARLEDILGVRMAERRLVGRVMAYWHDRCDGGVMPRFEAIDGAAMGSDWDHCFLIDVRPQFAAPATVHLGAALQRLSGVLISRRMRVVIDVLTLVQVKIDEVCRIAGPVLVEAEFPVSDHERLLTRGVFLPIGEDDDEIAFILGAANGKLAPSVPGM